MSHPDISRDFLPRIVIRDKRDALVILEALAIRSRHVDDTPDTASLRAIVRGFALELPGRVSDLPESAATAEAEAAGRWGQPHKGDDE